MVSIQMTYRMVGVIETQAADKANLFPREGCQELLHRQDVLRDLSLGVKRRADNLVRLDELLLVKRETHCPRTIQLNSQAPYLEH